MKNKLILLFIAMSLLPFCAFAQDNDLVDNSTATENVVSNEDSVQVAGLSDIRFGFCNEGIDNLSQSLNYAVSQGTPFKICIYLQNNSDYDAYVEVRLVGAGGESEGILIPDYRLTGIQDFVDKDDLESLKEIKIPAHNYIIKEISLVYPIGIDGEQQACLTYHTLGGPTSTAMVQVVHNRKYDMRFFVGDLDNVKNEITMTDIELKMSEDKLLSLNFLLNNVGNLENSIKLKGTIKNILGFKRDFEFDAGNLGIGGNKPITIELGSIPSYGGLFSIEMEATATPFFSYDVSHSNIDPSLLEDKTFTVSTSYFQMPWLILIIVVLVILFLIVAFRKPKGKNQQVVYVQAPQQPQAPQQ